jgi:hypothetical protein
VRATRWITTAALLGLLTAPPPVEAGGAAFFLMHGPPHPETFVVKLRDPEQIERARRILAREEPLAVHVMGRVHRRGKPWNPPWNYRLVPRSVQFFEVAIEVCDASIRYVEEHLDEVGGAFLPGRVWCPWGSRLVEEIPRP